MRKVVNSIGVALLSAFFAGYLHSQQLPQSVRSARNIGEILGMTEEETGKCGTSAILRAQSVWNHLSVETRNKVLHVSQRVERQKSRLSPTGRFRIHYDTTGFDAPALITAGANGQRVPDTVERYVDSVAYYFDYAWKLEIDTLRYASPPGDGVQGGGPEYDVYIQDYGSGTFGSTEWSQSDIVENGSRQRYTTYTLIENDFLGYRTPGIDGLRITAAHEFFHAIQVGSYGIWTTVPDMDRWFLELSAVWMEKVSSPGVHDYWFDAPNYFQRFRGALNQSLPLNSSLYGGYERAVWAFFLEQRFGRKVMNDLWIGIKSAPPIASMAAVLPTYGTSLESEFALFSSWNYFTSDRANTSKYYVEGNRYPRVTPNVTTTFTGLTASISSAAPPLSTQFYEIVLTSDTITAIIANVDVKGAQDLNASKSNLQINLSATDLKPPYQKVARGLGLTFTAGDPKMWRTQYMLASTRGNANTAPDPSPNPVRLAQDSKLVLPVQGATQNQAEVFLMNGAVELVFTRQYAVKQLFGNSYIELPTADLRSSVSSGVYFVMVRCGDQEFKWKVAIIQ